LGEAGGNESGRVIDGLCPGVGVADAYLNKVGFCS
jgi:hypothetical protein